MLHEFNFNPSFCGMIAAAAWAMATQDMGRPKFIAPKHSFTRRTTPFDPYGEHAHSSQRLTIIGDQAGPALCWLPARSISFGGSSPSVVLALVVGKLRNSYDMDEASAR